MNDPIADLVVRIKNANKARIPSVSLSGSNLTTSIIDVLKKEGYIAQYKVVSTNKKKTTVIDLKGAENIANYFLDNGYDVEVSEGCMLDSYFIEVGENNLKIGRAKVRKYIMIIDEYVNEWTSRLKLIMTDDYNKFSEVRNSYIKEL